MQKRLRELGGHPLVGEVRGVGLIAAIELVLDKARKVAGSTPGALGGVASRLLLERGIISRNMLDALAICPPLIVTKGQIDEMVDGIAGMLEELKPEAAKLTPAQ
jgi:4-aminobutyrate--pyruvate transaminase